MRFIFSAFGRHTTGSSELVTDAYHGFISNISRAVTAPTNIARRGGKTVTIFCPYNPPNIGHNNPNLGSSLVDVTQSIVPSVHQFIDDILVHNTIRRDWCGELREGSLTEQGLIKRLRTFTKGGPPFGKTGSPGLTPTEPPANDQKLAGLAFCQSYQSLSTIWEGYMSENRATRTYPPYRVVHHKQRIY